MVCWQIGSLESLISSATVSSIPGLLQALGAGGSTSDLLSGGEPAPDDPGGGGKLPEPPPEPAVPRVVNACIKHLTEYGLNTLGIFRVSSSKKRVRQVSGGWQGRVGQGAVEAEAFIVAVRVRFSSGRSSTAAGPWS